MVIEAYINEVSDAVIKNDTFLTICLKIFSDEKARSFSDGVGVHWYQGSLSPLDLMTEIHARYPDQILFGTEASQGKNLIRNIYKKSPCSSSIATLMLFKVSSVLSDNIMKRL